MKNYAKILVLVVVFCFAASITFAGNSLDSRSSDFGIFAGVLLPGTISVEDVDLDTEMGFTVKAY
ncbi:MAG: hypothetical protein ACUVRK_00500 [Spirochaetota bacterium]